MSVRLGSRHPQRGTTCPIAKSSDCTLTGKRKELRTTVPNLPPWVTVGPRDLTEFNLKDIKSLCLEIRRNF